MKSVFALLFATVSAVQLTQSGAPMLVQLSEEPKAPGTVETAQEKNAKADAADAKAGAKISVGKDAVIVAEAIQSGNKTPQQDADDKAAKHAKISSDNDIDMESKAAYWAGHGTPLAISHGDTAAMAAPVGGFDPSLNPGGDHTTSIESTNTVSKAAEHAAAAPIYAAAVQLVEEPKAPGTDESNVEKVAKADAAEAKAAAKAAPVVEAPQPENKTPQQAADDASAKHAKISSDNDHDMGSNAAIWAGSGAPPQITAGDTATMAAPRPGFDPSLNPGGDHTTSIESHNTEQKAAEHAAAAAPAVAPAAFAQAQYIMT